MFVQLNRIGDSITGAVNGESFGLTFSQDKWDELGKLAQAANSSATMEELKGNLEAFEAATKENYKDLVEHKTPYLFVNNATGQFFLKVGSGDKTKISSQPLPSAFVDRILESIELGLDVLPLVKAWSRFLRNPNYSSVKAQYFANYINRTHTNYEYVTKLMEDDGVSEEVAKRRATMYQTPITQEGLICTYKVSNELHEKWVLDSDNEPKQVPLVQPTIDPISGLITYGAPQFVEQRIFYPAVMGLEGGDDFYSGDDLGHTIRVGRSHRLANWNQVNCTDGTCCVKGLHCGNIDYVKGYQHQDTQTHNVFVDPMNIGAFTEDGTGAIRVLEYFVHSSFAGVNSSIYHSSEYAKKTDEQYQALFEEAVDAHKVIVDDAVLQVEELEALRVI